MWSSETAEWGKRSGAIFGRWGPLPVETERCGNERFPAWKTQVNANVFQRMWVEIPAWERISRSTTFKLSLAGVKQHLNLLKANYGHQVQTNQTLCIAVPIVDIKSVTAWQALGNGMQPVPFHKISEGRLIVLFLEVLIHFIDITNNIRLTFHFYPKTSIWINVNVNEINKSNMQNIKLSSCFLTSMNLNGRFIFKKSEKIVQIRKLFSSIKTNAESIYIPVRDALLNIQWM